ncbi:MAG: hypothetical protein LBL66_05205 [Clostridiales bacterium]|jgi:hypothetical protein|nr:hypothetical protein [Clostridiales bacterium]
MKTEQRNELAAEVRADFEKRREERRGRELQWRLNMNFLRGDQYCAVTRKGNIEDEARNYYWQEREVFNHLAPIIETRMAKLGRVKPVMGVMPAGGTQKDVFAAKTAAKILDAAGNRLALDAIAMQVTMWSEACGTAFYKITWETGLGLCLGETEGRKVYEGDVGLTACPPFEIYPDCQDADTLAGARSLIHARAVPVKFIAEKWGANVAAEPDCGRENAAHLIERYDLPDAKSPNGRLTVVAGADVLHDGPLPYINGADGARGFPFVMQRSIELPGSFWGVSVLERAIPVQRAYNAVKNRKQEFLNRISMGVLAVEDGSCDTDNLEEEGLNPGKVVVYRAGSNPPAMMDTGRLPSELIVEEERLLSEFIGISGVSEIMRNSGLPQSNISGIALQLLIEQDDTRLSVTAELMKKAVRGTAAQILRLYRQFASTPRIGRIADKDGAPEVFYWSKSDVGADEVYFVSDSGVTETPAQRRNMVFELLRAGLLHNEDGKLDNSARVKVLDMLGFGMWENAQDLNALHVKRAVLENQRLEKGETPPSEIDEHGLHIVEHTRYLLANECADAVKERIVAHIRLHKGMQGVGD